ncbi:MAG: SRPBCC family protein [Vicinamibacterales bacterium]
MTHTRHFPLTASGHRGVRWLFLVTAIACAAELSGAGVEPQVSVREERGIYHVSATFDVPQSPAVVFAVLTDYEHVPKFMPDVRTSVVREREGGRVVIEQEATAKFMLFSKKVRLMLEVFEDPAIITFRDTSGASFSLYEGRWTMAVAGAGTSIGYALTANPSFSVPEVVLTRLMKRDAVRLIDGLQAEMARRATLTLAASSGSARPR